MEKRDCWPSSPSPGAPVSAMVDLDNLNLLRRFVDGRKGDEGSGTCRAEEIEVGGVGSRGEVGRRRSGRLLLS